MKRILFALTALVLVIGTVGAGTFAYFSDTETSSGNTFAAGTLDLKVGNENPNESPDFTIGDVKPGDSGTITYTLTNLGTIAGYIDLSGISVSDSEGTNPESETGSLGDPGELSQNINVNVKVGTQTVYEGLLKNIASSYDVDAALGAGDETTLTIEWSVPTSVGNEIQGDTVTVVLTIELDQTAD